MTYEDAEYVVKQLKQAKIECHIDKITHHINTKKLLILTASVIIITRTSAL